MKNLLIVDDESDICDFLSDFFKSKGIIARTALSADEALAKIGVQMPDLCLLDIRMPRVDGLELLGIIKAKYPKLRAVMLTALDSQDLIDKALSLGAESYLVKPIDLESLEQFVEREEAEIG